MKAIYSTYFGLMAEFNAAEIPLEDCCDKYFGLSPIVAKRKALERSLPVRAYRPSPSQKCGWLVSIADLAAQIDAEKDKEQKLFTAMSEQPPA